jgi:hypothetical protein
MPAPFLIAPMLISLSLIGTPVTDTRLPLLDPAAASETEALPPEAVEELEAHQPAVVQPLSGISVELECLAYPDGYVANCAVVNETRPGLGFGEAAVALMNGSSAGSAVQTGRSAPVKFRHTIEFTPD